MENYETLRFFEETLENLKSVYRAKPVALAYDLHPGYMSTGWALKQDLPKLGVQHHHAHIASVMAECGIASGKVVGVAFDGTGYGTDGTLWGGEFLLADALGFKRAGHLVPVPLPGGTAAVNQPWRTAISYVLQAAGTEAEECLRTAGFMERYGRQQVQGVLKLAGLAEFSPPSSGAGRLFDAVSALLGICDTNTFEGEAAMALEAAMATQETEEDYPLEIKLKGALEVDFSFAIIGIINDMKNGLDTGVIAVKFHNTVAQAVLRVAIKLAHTHSLPDVAISGGVFQNGYLMRKVTEGLMAEGLQVHTNRTVPLNDGGISLGQAHVLRAHIKAGRLRL